MIQQQVVDRGISDERLLAAFRKVPRDKFFPAGSKDSVFADRAAPIGHGQTISQPYMVADLLQMAQLSGQERVLDVGTGSGYQAALLAELAAEVVTIERKPELAWKARDLLQALGYTTIRTVVGDGSEGYPPGAPYDRILVAASSPQIPPALMEQLAPHGRLILPVGKADVQTLMLVTKDAEGRIFTSPHALCAFVPLVGSQGWQDDPDLSS